MVKIPLCPTPWAQDMLKQSSWETAMVKNPRSKVLQPQVRFLGFYTRPGKHTKNYGKSPFSMDKSTINGHFQ
jgi:hypothetical protein